MSPAQYLLTLWIVIAGGSMAILLCAYGVIKVLGLK